MSQAKSITSSIIASLFIFLFVYTAISKFFEFDLFQMTLYNSPLIGAKAQFISWMLPLVELIIAALLVTQKTQRVGLYASLFLMIFFTAYILHMLLFSVKLPCSCGGVLKSMTWQEHFAFNIFFTCLALVGVIVGRKKIAYGNSNNIFQVT